MNKILLRTMLALSIFTMAAPALAQGVLTNNRRASAIAVHLGGGYGSYAGSGQSDIEFQGHFGGRYCCCRWLPLAWLHGLGHDFLDGDDRCRLPFRLGFAGFGWAIHVRLNVAIAFSFGAIASILVTPVPVASPAVAPP